VYLAHCILLNPSCALYLVAYKRIITSTSISNPLQSWISYNVKFCTKAASDPSLRWDIWDLDLWLENFPGKTSQPIIGHIVIVVYPSNCPFLSSPSQTNGGGPSAYGGPPAHGGGPPTHGGGSPAYRRRPPTSTNSQQQPVLFYPNTCCDFNRSNCHRANCRFTHSCENCGGPRSCPFKGQPTLVKPLPMTPLQPFILERELSNYPDKVFVRQLIDDLRHGCAIGYTGP